MTDQLWNDGWPAWADAGKRVTLLDADGAQLTGELEVGDYFLLDDGDEEPMFVVRTSDGVEHSFACAEKWRFV